MSSDEPGEMVFCRHCGEEIHLAAEICPECGVRQRHPPQTPGENLLDGTNPLIAALLSLLFPGLGHIYARETDMGLFFAVAFILALLSLMVAIGFVLVPAIWLYAIYDAAKAAERREAELTSKTEAV